MEEQARDEFRARCRELNLAVTIQRLGIFEYVASVTSHPTADQVYEAVRKRFPMMSRTSVYRTLDTFSRHGLIKRLVHPGTAVRYDGNTQMHYHFYCLDCGAVFDIFPTKPVPEFWKDVEGMVGGFVVEDCSIVFTGSCASCRQSPTESVSEGDEVALRKGQGE